MCRATQGCQTPVRSLEGSLYSTTSRPRDSGVASLCLPDVVCVVDLWAGRGRGEGGSEASPRKGGRGRFRLQLETTMFEAQGRTGEVH
jgi:hypothetical protein